jgi:hypothetical protein
VIKVNRDAAMDTSNKKTSFGAVGRDYNRTVLASMCSSKSYIIDPTVVEA